MATTREIRIITLFVECEKERGPIGPAVAERAYKVEGLNNVIVMSEAAMTDRIDVQAAADAFERLAIRQEREHREGNKS